MTSELHVKFITTRLVFLSQARLTNNIEMAGNCNLVSILGLSLVLTIFHNPIVVYAGEGVPNVALFAFGDSYYDAGNKVFIGKEKNPAQTYWPYGKSRDDPNGKYSNGPAQTYWPYGKSRDDPNGKFSDGHIVPDFIADFMSIPNGVLPPAFNPGSNVTRGVSFAVEDASILGSPVESLTLTQQVEAFKSMKSKWADEYIKQSLFMIYIGTEDYLKFIQTYPGADPSKQQAFVCQVITQLRNDIKTLTTLGARKFVVQLLAPLGCLPIVRQDYKTGFDSCYEPLNDLAKQHNAKIGPMLNDFAKSPEIDGFQFAVFDFYNAIIRRIQRERHLNYRFYVTNTSCCGVGTHQAYGCGKGNVHSKLCDYQRAYLFFDGRHNSEKAQEEFGNLIFSANLNVIQPMNGRELIVYPNGEKMREFYESSTPPPPSCDSKIGISAF